MKKQCEVVPEKIKTTPVAKNIMISDDFMRVYFHKWLKNDTTKATDITRMRPLSSKQLILWDTINEKIILTCRWLPGNRVFMVWKNYSSTRGWQSFEMRPVLVELKTHSQTMMLILHYRWRTFFLMMLQKIMHGLEGIKSNWLKVCFQLRK